MQSVEVRLAFPQRVIELGFEGDEVIEIVARTKRGALSKGNVRQKAALICVDILVAEKRPNMADLLRYLRVEGGHVIDGRTLLVVMPDEEALVQEFDSMSDVYNVRIDDRLAKADSRSNGQITDPIVIE